MCDLLEFATYHKVFHFYICVSLCVLATLRLAAGDLVGLKWCWRACVLKDV